MTEEIRNEFDKEKLVQQKARELKEDLYKKGFQFQEQATCGMIARESLRNKLERIRGQLVNQLTEIDSQLDFVRKYPDVDRLGFDIVTKRY